MSQRVLITGGAGFVGYHLANHLLNNTNDNLLLVDNLQRGALDDDLQKLLAHKRVSFLQLDLTDPESYDVLDKDVDQIYHLAAVNGTRWFYEKPAEVLRINTLSSIYLLEWVRTLEKKPKLCFTSSNEAYAGALAAFDQLPIPTSEKVPLVIEDPYNPRWTYAGTKLLGEQLFIHYAKTYDLQAIVVRPHNFYGPRAGFDHVIPQWCKRIVEKEDPFVLFGASQTRSFCYIEDAVRAMRLLLEGDIAYKSPIATVHIGTPVESTIGDLAQQLFKVADWSPKSFIQKDALEGSVQRRCPDVSLLQSLVDWKPQVSLEEGLDLTYRWYHQYHTGENSNDSNDNASSDETLKKEMPQIFSTDDGAGGISKVLGYVLSVSLFVSIILAVSHFDNFVENTAHIIIIAVLFSIQVLVHAATRIFKWQWADAFAQGAAMFGAGVNKVVVGSALTAVYFFGIGLTSIISKLFGKRFLDLDKKSTDSFWHTINLTQERRSRYFDMF